MRERADGLAALGEAVLPEIRSGSSDRALVALASALAALDRYHRWFPIRLAGAHEVELPKLPGWSESRRYLFLPPPPDLGLLTDDLDPLDRDPSFFKHHLWRVLDLHWHLIDLERHGPVRLLDLSELDSVTETLLARGVARDGGLRIGLASPFRDLAYQAWSQPDDAHPDKGVPYRFVALESSPGPARDELSRILDACREQSVDILCFPELTLDDGLLQWLKDCLAFDGEESPALVVAGSFHEQHDGRWRNRSRLLGVGGKELLRQDKFLDFRIPAAQVPAPDPERPTFLDQLGLEGRGGYENIAPADELVLLDSPALGRIVLPICLDFFGDELAETFLETRANLFLVPAMSQSLGKFEDKARKLGDSNRAASFVVNSAWLLRQLRMSEETIEALRVVAYLPCRGGLCTAWDLVRGCQSLMIFDASVILEGRRR